MTKHLLALSILTTFCGLALVGCGRKGPLELPQSSVIKNTNDTKVQKPQENKPFILDGLIK